MTGKLYVIGTPIGNLADISLRAIESLEKIEVLFCEDSRVSAKLVNYLLEKKLISKKPIYIAYNEFNEEVKAQEVVERVAVGEQVGLVSDAGMPAISDPGYRAIRGCLEAKLEVRIIPGPTALTTALPYCGIGGEVVLYLGFLPKTGGKAKRMLESGREIWKKTPSARVVLYVSPHRVRKDLRLIGEVMGEVRCVLLRELTKMHEERVEGTVSELSEKFERQKPKGEMVLVLTRTDERQKTKDER